MANMNQEKFVVTLCRGENTVLKAEFNTFVDCIRAAANHYRKFYPNSRFGVQRVVFDGEVSLYEYNVVIDNVEQEKDFLRIVPLIDYSTPQQIASELFELSNSMKDKDFIEIRESDRELIQKAAKKIREMDHMIMELTSGVETEE